MYVVFARKYRPERFDGVVGQKHITRALQNAVRTGRVAHAYLFCGSRGVGKTTAARLLAKALNCEQGPTPQPCCSCESCRRIALGNDLDVMEIDGASNRGIDQVRELRQNVGLAPAHGRFKIYYIDEVHMLTEPAFNALLKTLEEPPAHVKFIFSTTDPQKLPETVKSRCQRFDFRRIGDADISAHLQEICTKEGLRVEEGGLAAIARSARGSLRDALGALDQLAAFGEEVTLQDVHAVLGTVEESRLSRITEALAAEDTSAALEATDELLFSGTDVADFADQFSQYLRDLLVARCAGADSPMLAGAVADEETLSAQAALFTPEQLTYMIQVLREAKLRARRDSTGRIAMELAVVKLSRMSAMAPVAEALAALQQSSEAAGGAVGDKSQGEDSEQQGSTDDQAPTAGRLRRMKERLNNRKPRPKSGGPPSPPPVRAEEVPEGMTDTKYRQLLNSAPEPDVARDAVQDKGLLKAFIEADRALGLDPLKVERLTTAPDEQMEEPEQENT